MTIRLDPEKRKTKHSAEDPTPALQAHPLRDPSSLLPQHEGRREGVVLLRIRRLHRSEVRRPDHRARCTSAQRRRGRRRNPATRTSAGGSAAVVVDMGEVTLVSSAAAAAASSAVRATGLMRVVASTTASAARRFIEETLVRHLAVHLGADEGLLDHGFDALLIYDEAVELLSCAGAIRSIRRKGS